MINRKRLEVMPVRHTFFVISLFTVLMSSCGTFNRNLIHYNEEKDLYEYGVTPENSILLRNSNNELISESNYESFVNQLEANDNKYGNDKLTENANSLKSIDHKIATLYSGAVHAIHTNQFEEVPAKVDKLLSLYPDALYFSDCSFLSAFAFEKLGKTSDAKEKYQEYLTYSSGKFTERFRGYRDSDPRDSIWLEQRKYAEAYISGENNVENESFFEPFIPRYYYSSFHPGYSVNPEDYSEKTEHIMMLVLGSDISNNAAFGIQYYYPIHKIFDINPRYITSKGVNEAGLAIPIKLYKSVSNRFAFKISPFLNYSRINELTIDDNTWEIDDNMFDYGVKVSAGYYLAPKFSLGASYIHHRYNKNNRYVVDNQGIEIWYFNEYDISFYYALSKGFSLKSGIKAGDFVAGLYWSGWEISYNFNESEFVFRIDMF